MCCLPRWRCSRFERQVRQSGVQIIDHLYFSYTTITTAGCGDVTARSEVGRIPEALFGQFHLVTVVGVLVGRMRPRRGTIG